MLKRKKNIFSRHDRGAAGSDIMVIVSQKKTSSPLRGAPFLGSSPIVINVLNVLAEATNYAPAPIVVKHNLSRFQRSPPKEGVIVTEPVPDVLPVSLRSYIEKAAM